MEYNIRCEQLGSRPLAVVRRRARPEELSKVVLDACGIVCGVIRSQQIHGVGRHVAVYLDGQINLEVGVELDPRSPAPARSSARALRRASSPQRPITGHTDS